MLDDAWTVEQEARLVYVQAQLRAAQAAWSEEQELWIDEVRFCDFFCFFFLVWVFFEV